jgi:hypothetical protein
MNNGWLASDFGANRCRREGADRIVGKDTKMERLLLRVECETGT